MQAVKAAAVLTAAYSAAAEGTLVNALVTAHRAAAAVDMLPHTLSTLLRHSAWRQVPPTLPLNC